MSDAAAAVQRWLDAVNTVDLDLFRSIVAPGYIHHSGAGDLTADDVVEGFWFYKRAFSDFRYELHELLTVEGGAAAIARWTMRGTHDGPFFGAEPTGRTFASPGMSLHRVADGLITEEWEYNTDLGMLRELGFRLEKPAT